jgi:hypothetical protein
MIIGLYGLYYYSKNSNLPKFNPSVLNIKNSSSPNNKNKKKEKA